MMLGLIRFFYSARFELPQAPIHLHGVQNATVFGPACPQQALSPGVPISIPTHSVVSEGCTSLFIPALVPIHKDLSQV
jgi:carboxylesterase type B